MYVKVAVVRKDTEIIGSILELRIDNILELCAGDILPILAVLCPLVLAYTANTRKIKTSEVHLKQTFCSVLHMWTFTCAMLCTR